MSSENVGKWLDDVLNISALAIAFEAVRGPLHILEPDEVPGALQDAFAKGSLNPEGVSEICDLLDASELPGMLNRVQKIRKHITGVLTDPVYVNDDRDRELILAQIAMCRELDRLPKVDGRLPTRQLQEIWNRFDGDKLV